MGLAIAFILGGLFNMYRGGFFKNRDAVISRIQNSVLRKIVNFLVQGDTVNALAFAIFCALLSDNSAQVFAMMAMQAVMMLRGSTPAWGEYIGAAGGWRPSFDKPLQAEVSYIDKIIKPLADRPRLWGMAGLSIRCAEWGLLIGAALLSFYPMLAGLLAGPIVYMLSKIMTKPNAPIWKCFELIIGGLFWAATYLSLT